MSRAAGSAIRTIVFKKGGSVPATFQITRDISTVNFDNTATYKRQPKKRQEVIDNTTAFAVVSGLDAGGAEIADIPGGFHSGGPGVDKFSRVTATIRDKHKNQLYFYRKTDGLFFDRIHVPENKVAPEWPQHQIYYVISHADFLAKKKPAHV